MAKLTEKIRDNSSIRRKSVQMNKELIMDTAARLFAESSYETVSLDDIANNIGATKGLIYHYFPSKGALLGELLLWTHNLFRESVNPAWETTDADPVDKLKKIIKAHIDFNYEYSYMIIVVFRTVNLIPLEMRRKIKRLRESYTKKFRSLIEDVQEVGQLVQGDSESVTMSIMSLINYLPYRYRNAEIHRRKELYELVIRIFFR